MPASSLAERNARTLLWFRALCNFQPLFPIWVYYLMAYRGFSLTQVAALEAPYLLALVIFEVPTGAFADRFGRRRSIVAGSAIYAASILLFGLAGSFPLLLADYLAWALAQALINGADHALLYESLADAGREREFARWTGRLGAAGILAVVGGNLLGAPLAAFVDLRFPILVSAGLTLGSVLFALRLREPPGHQRHGGSFTSALAGGLRLAARRAALRYTVLLLAAVGATTAASVLFRQPFLNRYGVPLAWWGVLQAPGPLLFALGAARMGGLVHRFGERLVVLALPLMAVAALAALATVDSIWVYPALYPCSPGSRACYRP